MLKVDKYKQQIEENCRALRVKRLDLVGSAARDDFRPEQSDIDIWVAGNRRLQWGNI